MTQLRLMIALGLVALTFTFACSKAIKPLPDKNTNWLRKCDADADCGSELACLCGACTKTCGSSSQCEPASSDAICVRSSDPGVEAVCGTQLPAAAICAATCDRDRDCDAQAKGLRCQSGLCVPRATTDEPIECNPGDVIAKICGMECPGLNHNAFATCSADGQYGPCICQDPKCGPATDCAAGYICFGFRCLEAANRCIGISCEPGATCIDNLCVKVLADGQSSPTDLAIADDGTLYFVNSGTYADNGEFNFDASFMRVPANGSELVTRVAEDLNEIGRMTIDRNDAYWFSRRNGVAFQIMGSKLPDGPTNAMFLTGEALSPLVADADWLYWIARKESNGPVELLRIARDEPVAPTTLLQLEGPAGALALSGDRVYWGSTELGLWSANKDGSDARRVVTATSELQGPFELAVDDSGVYWSWTNQPDLGLGLYAEGPDTNLRLTESMRGRLATTLAVDPTHVYWIYADAASDAFQLSRTSKVPYDTEVVWRSPQLKAATRVLLRDGFLYLTLAGENPGQGRVIRVQVPPTGR
jgi:hypothetical protein